MKKGKKGTSPPTSPCADLRAAYNSCFYKWYSENFVKGQWDKEGCVSEWLKYRACLSEHLDDRHLSRFLAADGLMTESVKPASRDNPKDEGGFDQK